MSLPYCKGSPHGVAFHRCAVAVAVCWCGVVGCGVGQDGAARVVDPIFVHVNSGGRDAPHGFFWKDYLKASW